MTRVAGFAGLLVALGCAVLAGVPARATEATRQIPQLSPSLRYEVSGQVSANCVLRQSVREVEIDGVQNPQTNTAQAATAELPFSINCSTPVQVVMTSAYGGLQHLGAGTSDPDFTSLIPYSATVDMPGRSGVLTCQSAQMTEAADNCSATVSQGGVIEGEGTVRVQTQAGEGLLIAGSYRDTVRLVVTPILGDGPI